MWDIGTILQQLGIGLILLFAGWLLNHYRVNYSDVKGRAKTFLSKLRRGGQAAKPLNEQHPSIDVTQLIRSQKELREFHSMHQANGISYGALILGMITGVLLNVFTVLYPPLDLYVDLIFFGILVYLGGSAIVIFVQHIRLRRKFTHPDIISKVFRSQLKDIAAGEKDVFIPAEVDLPPSKEESIRKALLNHFPEQFFDMTAPETVLWTYANVFAHNIHVDKITRNSRTLPDSLIDLLASYERLEQLTIVVYRLLRKESDQALGFSDR